MDQKYITIQGARENNLKNISLKIPKDKLVVVVLKVSIPSGILWIIKARALITPSLYNLLSIFLNTLSIKLARKTPIIINKSTTTTIPLLLYLLCNKVILSGKRENKETESITPLAKAKEALIILSLFFVFINTGIIPSRVDKPAIPVIKNEKYNLFMINTMLNLEKNAKLC